MLTCLHEDFSRLKRGQKKKRGQRRDSRCLHASTRHTHNTLLTYLSCTLQFCAGRRGGKERGKKPPHNAGQKARETRWHFCSPLHLGGSDCWESRPTCSMQLWLPRQQQFASTLVEPKDTRGTTLLSRRLLQVYCTFYPTLSLTLSHSISSSHPLTHIRRTPHPLQTPSRPPARLGSTNRARTAGRPLPSTASGLGQALPLH